MVNSVSIIKDFFRSTRLRHWPGLVIYLIGATAFKKFGIRLFRERLLVLNDFKVAVTVDGKNGLNFFHEIHFRGIYRFEAWEQSTRIQSVFDVGANCGYFTLEVAKRNPSWRFHCFEPHPKTFSTLLRNVRANDLSDRVTALQVAAGSEPGVCKMDISPASSMAIATAVDAHSVGSMTLEVPQVTLDEIAGKSGTFPDLIKIDVEGFEVAVLDGAAQCLKHAQFVVLEFHSDPLREACLDRLTAAGYQCDLRGALIFGRRSNVERANPTQDSDLSPAGEK